MIEVEQQHNSPLKGTRKTMSDDIMLTDDAFTYSGPLAARMACHMGDFKASALCNILGDQPLFYIDYVDAEEADFADPMNLLMSEETEFDANNIDQLRRRMSRLEGACAHIDGYARENVELAFDVASQLRSEKEISSDDIIAALKQSGFTSALLEGCAARGLTIHTNASVDTAFYDRDQIAIHVNPRLSAPLAALMAARSLRQAWLHINGALINPLHFAPEEAVLLNRIQNADQICAMMRTAWELNLSGNKDAWARILTGSAYDLAVGFAREAISDFRSLTNGSAAHATFERWFFSGRCKDTDRKLIQSMLADHHGLVFDNPAVSKMVTADIIARTGDMPQGKNYLSASVDIILSDPLFTEVRDRSNANFLWFIKFERSFRASEEGNLEQNLQGIPAVPAGAIKGASTKEQANHAENAKKADVIAFKGVQAPSGAVSGRKNGTGNMATVYYIDHFIDVTQR